MKLFVFVSCLFDLLLVDFAHALPGGKIRLRAREHYEMHTIKSDVIDLKATYKGFSNTVNLWYEVPYVVSAGLAFSPILGAARNEDNPARVLGERVRLYSLGLEGKYFPFWRDGLKMFTRIGLGWSQLSTKGTISKANGLHVYLGVGWEFPVWKLSLAPEIAIRQSYLQSDLSVTSITPSIGVHFYSIL